MEESRLFVQPNQIYNALYCSICCEVFKDASILSCGHTYCEKCITDWIHENIKKKLKAKCPLCNSEVKGIVKKKVQLEKDLLARSIINDLEVFCKFKESGCVWKGMMQDSIHHMKE